MYIYSIIIKYNIEFSSLCYIAGPCWLSFFKFLFMYLFLVVLGLHCCVRAFSSCGERGLLFTVMDGLLIAVASLHMWHMGLVAPWHVDSSQTRNQTYVPCIGRQILNH